MLKIIKLGTAPYLLKYPLYINFLKDLIIKGFCSYKKGDSPLLLDLLSGKSEGKAGNDGVFELKLGSLQGKVLLFR